MKVDGLLLALFNTYRLVDKVIVALLLFPHAHFVSSGLLYFGSGCCLLGRSGSYFVSEVRTYLSLRFVLTVSQRFVLICHCDSYLVSTAVRSYYLRFVLTVSWFLRPFVLTICGSYLLCLNGSYSFVIVIHTWFPLPFVLLCN